MGDKWTTNDCNSGIHVLNRSESVCTLFSYSFSCSSYFKKKSFFNQSNHFWREVKEGVRRFYVFPFHTDYVITFSFAV